MYRGDCSVKKERVVSVTITFYVLFSFMLTLESTLPQLPEKPVTAESFFSDFDIDEREEIPLQQINFACDMKNENLIFVVYLSKIVVAETVLR